MPPENPEQQLGIAEKTDDFQKETPLNQMSQEEVRDALAELWDFPHSIFYNTFSSYEHYADDCIQEGRIAMWEAAKTYDKERGASFKTYVRKRILWAIVAFLKETPTLKISPERVQQTWKMDKFLNQYYQIYGRKPTTEEIADGMGIPEKKAKKIISARKRMSLISLDKLARKDGTESMHGFIEDHSTALKMESMVMKVDAEKWTKILLKIVIERHQRMIGHLYGMDGEEEKTFQETANIFGVKPQRINEIEKNFIKKARKILEI